MNNKKHIGVILILIGIVLTMNNTVGFKKAMETIKNSAEFMNIIHIMVYYMQRFWPIILLLIGIYLVMNPKKSKKQ